MMHDRARLDPATGLMTTRPRRRWRPTMVVASLVAVAASCGSDPTALTGRDGPVAGALGVLGATAGVPVAVPASGDEDVDLDGVFRWVNVAGTPSMDPHLVTSPYYDQFLFPVYDRLTRQLPDASVAPMLATEWEFVGEGADAALEMTLRDDVTFPSGTPFDAEVVRANIERARTGETSVLKGDLAVVESVEVLDPTRVRFELTGPAPGLLRILSDRAGMMIDPAAFENPDLGVLGAGAGPFEMTEHAPNTRLVYARRDGYWDPEAQRLAGIEITVLQDQEAMLNAVIVGQADAMAVTAQQIDRAEQGGLEIVRGEVGSNMILGFNVAKGPLADVRVRRALNHAVDRELIADEVLSGGCTATSQPGPPGYITNNPDIPADYYAFDPDQARALLTEAGVGDGFSMTAIVNNTPVYVQIAEAVQAMFADIGVEMAIEQAPGTNIVEIFYVNGQGDAIGAQGLSQPDPARQFASYYGSEGNLNPGKQAPEGFDEALAEASAILDDDERAAAFADLAQQVVDFAYRIDLCHQVRTYAHQPRVGGMQIFTLDTVDFRDVYMRNG